MIVTVHQMYTSNLCVDQHCNLFTLSIDIIYCDILLLMKVLKVCLNMNDDKNDIKT